MTDPFSTTAAPAAETKWYADWQHQQHASHFDGRASLPDADLVRNFASFNDVRLLGERLERSRPVSLLEIGCATGEFYRYLKIVHPQVRYYGVDISHAAIARAKEKYPEARIVPVEPKAKLAEAIERIGLAARPEIVWCKDVIHHQTDPFGLLHELLGAASEAVILRTRTRDVGPTVMDPEHSCQYHYDGWMPYLVLNLQELVDAIRRGAPEAEGVVYRHHMILGGRENRFLPKDCYLPSTGTAETAVGIFRTTNHPGRVTITDRTDMNVAYPLSWRVQRYCSRLLSPRRPARRGRHPMHQPCP